MHMLVTHLTRMGSPYICAAGCRVQKSGSSFTIGPHIRPVRAAHQQLDRGFLKTLFQLGSIVDLGSVNSIGVAPETEDYSFEPEHATSTQTLSRQEFWAIVTGSATNGLTEIFGSALQRVKISHNHSAAVNPGTGKASLGELQLNAIPHLYVTPFGQLRIQIADPSLATLDLPVTDVRFFRHAQGDWILQTSVVQKIGNQLASSVPSDIVLAVGLTRIYKGVHWLQANNVFVKQDPLW